MRLGHGTRFNFEYFVDFMQFRRTKTPPRFIRGILSLYSLPAASCVRSMPTDSHSKGIGAHYLFFDLMGSYGTTTPPAQEILCDVASIRLQKILHRIIRHTCQRKGGEIHARAQQYARVTLRHCPRQCLCRAYLCLRSLRNM